MVDRTSGLQYQTGQGYSALDAQAARDRLDGFSVVSGCGVSPGGSLSVDVAAGEALVGGTTVSPGSVQNVSLTAADSTNPRKDTIYIDDTGTAQVETGAAETPLPEGNARFNTFQPEPPRPGTDGTILAEVWVAAGASSLSSADVRDRRQPAEVVGGAANFNSVSTDQLSTQIGKPSDLSGNRSEGDVYQNTAGHVIYLVITVLADGTSGSQSIEKEIRWSNTSSDPQNVDTVDKAIFREGFTDLTIVSLSALIPDGAYYRLFAGTQDESEIDEWYEMGWSE